MLVKATKDEIAQYMDFAYELALDQTKSGYPLWSDGVSPKEQFVERVWKSYESEDRDLLLFVVDGAVEGWIQFFFIEEDRYLQTNGFLIRSHTDQVVSEFLEYARAHFAGYDLYLGFPKRNTQAIAALEKSNCRLIQEAYHNIYRFDGSEIPVDADGIVRVTEANFDAFRAIHQSDPETYWNAGRMLQALDEWLIFLLYRDDSPVGYVCSRNGEIFDLGFRDDQFDAAVFAILVKVVLRDLQAAGYRQMIFFVDEEEGEERQNAVLSLGFTCVSKYVLYLKRV